MIQYEVRLTTRYDQVRGSTKYHKRYELRLSTRYDHFKKVRQVQEQGTS